jgi:hypothetical protein
MSILNNLLNRDIHLVNPNNKKRLDLTNRDLIVYAFNMDSWDTIENIYKSHPLSELACDLYTGVLLKNYPTMKIGLINNHSKEDPPVPSIMKTLFDERWKHFFKLFYNAYNTKGIIFFKFIYDNALKLYYPVCIDTNDGCAICVYDKYNSSEKRYLWTWNAESISQGGKRLKFPDMSVSLDELMYDDTVFGYGILDIKINTRDNIMQWKEYITNISNNYTWMESPGQIESPFTTPMIKLLDEYFMITRLKNAYIITEEAKSTIHIIWKDNINYKNEELSNLIATFSDDTHSLNGLASTLQFKKMNNLQNKNRGSALKHGNVTLDQESLFNESYLLGNPKTQNINTMDQLYGEKIKSNGDVIQSLRNTQRNQMGIVEDTVHNGVFQSVFPGPLNEPYVIPKVSSNDIHEMVKSYSNNFMLTMGIPSSLSNSNRSFASNVSLEQETFSNRLNSMKTEFERFMNFFYNTLTIEERNLIVYMDKISDDDDDDKEVKDESDVKKELNEKSGKSSKTKRKESPNSKEKSNTRENGKVDNEKVKENNRKKKKKKIENPKDSSSSSSEGEEKEEEEEEIHNSQKSNKNIIIHNNREILSNTKKIEDIDLRVYFKLHPFEKVDHELLFKCLEKDVLDKTLVENIIKEALNIFKK